jgi:hypothetical protein
VFPHIAKKKDHAAGAMAAGVAGVARDLAG